MGMATPILSRHYRQWMRLALWHGVTLGVRWSSEFLKNSLDTTAAMNHNPISLVAPNLRDGYNSRCLHAAMLPIVWDWIHGGVAFSLHEAALDIRRTVHGPSSPARRENMPFGVFVSTRRADGTTHGTAVFHGDILAIFTRQNRNDGTMLEIAGCQRSHWAPRYSCVLWAMASQPLRHEHSCSSWHQITSLRCNDGADSHPPHRMDALAKTIEIPALPKTGTGWSYRRRADRGQAWSAVTARDQTTLTCSSWSRHSTAFVRRWRKMTLSL